MPKILYDQFFARATYKRDTWMWVTPNARMPVAAYALCEDGQRRTIRVNQHASNAFAHSGRATIGNKTMRGFLCTEDGALTFTLFNESINKLRGNKHVNAQTWFKTRCERLDSATAQLEQSLQDNSKDKEGSNQQSL